MDKNPNATIAVGRIRTDKSCPLSYAPSILLFATAVMQFLKDHDVQVLLSLQPFAEDIVHGGANSAYVVRENA